MYVWVYRSRITALKLSSQVTADETHRAVFNKNQTKGDKNIVYSRSFPPDKNLCSCYEGTLLMTKCFSLYG